MTTEEDNHPGNTIENIVSHLKLADALCIELLKAERELYRLYRIKFSKYFEYAKELDRQDLHIKDLWRINDELSDLIKRIEHVIHIIPMLIKDNKIDYEEVVIRLNAKRKYL